MMDFSLVQIIPADNGFPTYWNNTVMFQSNDWGVEEMTALSQVFKQRAAVSCRLV